MHFAFDKYKAKSLIKDILSSYTNRNSHKQQVKVWINSTTNTGAYRRAHPFYCKLPIGERRTQKDEPLSQKTDF